MSDPSTVSGTSSTAAAGRIPTSQLTAGVGDPTAIATGRIQAPQLAPGQVNVPLAAGPIQASQLAAGQVSVPSKDGTILLAVSPLERFLVDAFRISLFAPLDSEGIDYLTQAIFLATAISRRGPTPAGPFGGASSPADISLESAIAALQSIQQELKSMSDANTQVTAALAKLTADVAEQKTINASAVVAFQGLTAQLQAAVTAAQNAGATQAMLQPLLDLAAGVEASNASLAAAIPAGTPVAGTPAAGTPAAGSDTGTTGATGADSMGGASAGSTVSAEAPASPNNTTVSPNA